MKKFIIASFLIGSIILSIPPSYTYYQAPIPPTKPISAPHKHLKPVARKYTEPTELVAKYALQYNVSQETILKVIACESGNNPNAWNKNDPNGGSKGIAQFQETTFYGYAKEIGITNPDIWNFDQQIEVMGYMISIGKLNHWSCARILNLV